LGVSVIAVLSLGVAAAGPADDKKPADAPGGLKFTGRIQADATADLSARVAGAVDKVNGDEGDRVKKGQVLIELSAPELKDDVDAAVARLNRAKAEVEQAEAAVQTAKGRLAQDEAALHAAQDVYQRDVGNGAAVPAATLSDDRNQVEKAKAGVNVAKAEVGRAEAGVKTAQAGVEVAEAGAHRAQTRLELTKIVAPFDGVVTRRTVDVGTTVGALRQGDSAPLITVMRDDVVQAVFDVDERDIPKVAVGAPVVVRSSTQTEFQGKVTRIGGAVAPSTGAVRASVALPNPDGKLRPGMFVTVEVKAAPGK
jgi:multidrug efflux pump subunit AcrA (membrane-fusion protein)